MLNNMHVYIFVLTVTVLLLINARSQSCMYTVSHAGFSFSSLWVKTWTIWTECTQCLGRWRRVLKCWTNWMMHTVMRNIGPTETSGLLHFDYLWLCSQMQILWRSKSSLTEVARSNILKIKVISYRGSQMQIFWRSKSSLTAYVQ